MMNCDYCSVEMVDRLATEHDPYMYDLCGLEDVALVGIDVHKCPKCRFEAPIIPRIVELHEVIADGLILKPSPLSGAEVRYLRKYAGMPAREFARLLGIDPAYLSRIENGHTKALGATADRFVRAYTILAKDGRGGRELLLKVAADLESKQKKPPRISTFMLDKRRWVPMSKRKVA
jgi:transcriptional regulator with XRE-family HTH domain